MPTPVAQCMNDTTNVHGLEGRLGLRRASHQAVIVYRPVGIPISVRRAKDVACEPIHVVVPHGAHYDRRSHEEERTSES